MIKGRRGGGGGGGGKDKRNFMERGRWEEERALEGRLGLGLRREDKRGLRRKV